MTIQQFHQSLAEAQNIHTEAFQQIRDQFTAVKDDDGDSDGWDMWPSSP